MSNKRIVDLLQNLLLLVLTASAVYLLTRFPMLEGAVTGKMQELLARPSHTVQQSGDVSTAVTSVHLVVTDHLEYGRYVGLNSQVSGADFQRLAPVFREAIGSAAAGEVVSDEEFQAAMTLPGIYVDLKTNLPMDIVSAWLGEQFDGEDPVRGVGLVTTGETASLYLYGADGEIVRCTTALTSAAVSQLTAGFAPNGGRFAFETDYETLEPYTVLVQEVSNVPDLQPRIPVEFNAYNLLTALEFNAHTTSRYFESSGVEVVIQSPLTLRIGTDGSVNFSTDGEVPRGIYQLTAADTVPAVQEVLQGACVIAQTLCEATNAAPLSLNSVERTEQGWIVTFCYQVDGIRVHLGRDRDALRIVIDGNTVTSFDFFCRNFLPVERGEMLLPPSMAVAIASLHEDAELVLAYVDGDAELLSARWFVR